MREYLGKALRKINANAGSARKLIPRGLDEALGPMAPREDGLNDVQPPERGMTAAAWRKSEDETCVGWAPTTIDVPPLCAHDLCLLFCTRHHQVKTWTSGGLYKYVAWDNGTHIILPVISEGMTLAREDPENSRTYVISLPLSRYLVEELDNENEARPSVESVADFTHNQGVCVAGLDQKGVAPCRK